MVLRMELVLLWQVHAWVCRALMGKHQVPPNTSHSIFFTQNEDRSSTAHV